LFIPVPCLSCSVLGVVELSACGPRGSARPEGHTRRWKGTVVPGSVLACRYILQTVRLGFPTLVDTITQGSRKPIQGGDTVMFQTAADKITADSESYSGN